MFEFFLTPFVMAPEPAGGASTIKPVKEEKTLTPTTYEQEQPVPLSPLGLPTGTV